MLSLIINKHSISFYLVNVTSIIININLIPFYVKILGIEAYGLIGFFTTIQSMFAIFDLGLSTTVGREVSKISIDKVNKLEIASLTKTLEIVYWSFALLLGLSIVLFSDFISQNWLNTSNLDEALVKKVIYLMGILFFIKWPISFYSNAIVGIEKIYHLNLLKVSFLFLQTLAIVLSLLYISESVITFFVVTLLVSSLNIIALVILMWSSIIEKVNYSWSNLDFNLKKSKTILKFTSGISLFSVLSLVIFQTDKLVISNLLTLEEFGLYSLASTIPFALFNLIYPVTNVMLPKYTQFYEIHDYHNLGKLFISSSQIVAIIATIFSVCFILLNNEILFFWLNDWVVVYKISTISITLMVGVYIHSFTNLISTLFIAFKRSDLLVKVYLIPSFILPILIIVLTNKYGLLGASYSWFIINIVLVNSYLFYLMTELRGDNIKLWVLNPLIINSSIVLIVLLLIEFSNIKSYMNELSSISILLLISITLVFSHSDVRKAIRLFANQ
jgi:O-antigen/teichoic acid export membrane protein